MTNNENKILEPVAVKLEKMRNHLKTSGSGLYSVQGLAWMTGKSVQEIFYFINEDSDMEFDFINKDAILIKKKEVLKPIYNVPLFLQKLNYLRANYRSFNSLLSFKELSDITRISQNTFSNWQNGKVKSIKPVQLKKLLNVFKVKPRCFDDDISVLCLKEYFESESSIIFCKQKDELTYEQHVKEGLRSLNPYDGLDIVKCDYNKLNKIIYDDILRR